MGKEYKCKKCGLKYNSKYHTCPYCKKKRFNPTGIIIALVAVIAIGSIFVLKGDEIIATVSDITTTKSVESIDGIKFKILEKNITKTDSGKEIKITFEAENTNNYDIQLDYELSAYVDEYLTEMSSESITNIWSIFSWKKGDLTEVIAAKKKCKYTTYIELPEEWNEIEIYCKKAFILDEENQNILVMTIKNNEK